MPLQGIVSGPIQLAAFAAECADVAPGFAGQGIQSQIEGTVTIRNLSEKSLAFSLAPDDKGPTCSRDGYPRASVLGSDLRWHGAWHAWIHCDEAYDLQQFPIEVRYMHCH